MACPHSFTSCPVPSYERCRSCGTYRSLAPASPDRLYEEHFWHHDHHCSAHEQAWNVDMHTEGGFSKNRFVLDRIEATRGTAIDVGCSPGRLLYWLRWAARFDKVVGIDPSNPEHIRKVGCFDDELMTGLFAEVSPRFHDGAADYVCALDVFEHLFEPVVFLAECHRILNPDGQLFLMLPVADELPVTSRFFAPAEHVFLHSRKHLRDLVAEAGYDRIRFDRWTVGHETISARKPGGA